MQEGLINGERSAEEEREFLEFKRKKKYDEARANVAKIEADCLSPFTDKAAIREACKAANALAMGGVVIYSSLLKPCVDFLGKDPQTALICCISYPHGLDGTADKAYSIKRAVKNGADEVEVYAPVQLIKDGNFSYFKRECKKVKRAAKNRAVRVAFDCTLIGGEQLFKACSIAADAGINCVRLNGADGQTVADVKKALKGKCLIKADGAESLSSFGALCAMGADFVSCGSATQLARLILRQAEN